MNASTPRVPSEDQIVIDIVRSSRLFAAISTAATALSRAVDSSSSVAWARKAHTRWGRGSSSEQARGGGVALVTAAVVYVVLNSSLGDPVGRMWMSIPFAVTMFGAVLIVASAFPRYRVDELRRDRSDQHVGKRV
jgi:hypothetical protein